MFDVWWFDNWSDSEIGPTGDAVQIRAPYWTGDNPDDAALMAELYAGRLLEDGKAGCVVVLGPIGDRIGDLIDLQTMAAA